MTTMDQRLCLIYNFAPKYREGIFRLIDSEYDCHWYFGRNNTDIKGLDCSFLKNVTELDVVKIRKTPFTWQKGVLRLLDNPEYGTFFILGDINSLSTWALLLKRKLRHHGKRIYVWTHGWYGKESALRVWLKKRFFRMTDGVFLYGNYARNLMIKEGFNPERLYVIHNSLAHEKQKELRQKLQPSDILRNHFHNDNSNLIFIGRLTGVKRLEMLIEAMAILRERGMPTNLTLVGDGVKRAKLERLSKEKDLTDRIWFKGECYDESVNASLIYNADVCVSPGNVGLTAIHTMTFGTPVITHNNFPMQMPEFEAITEGITGAFFEYNDTESLAETLEKWLTENRNRREEIREACFNEIDSNWTPQFQMEVINKNLKF